MSNQMRKLIDLVEEAQINQYLDRLQNAKTQEEFESIINEAKLIEAPGMVDKIKKGAMAGALGLGLSMGAMADEPASADPGADVNKSQAVQQVSGVDNSLVFSVPKGMYNQNEKTYYSSILNFAPGKDADGNPKPRPLDRVNIPADVEYAPPSLKIYNNFKYGKTNFETGETLYTDQWEAKLIKDTLTSLYQPLHKLYVPFHEAQKKYYTFLSNNNLYQTEFGGDISKWSAAKKEARKVESKLEKVVQDYYRSNIGVVSYKFSPKQINFIHYYMQTGQDLNKIIRNTTRGMKGESKLAMENVIKQIHAHYYANQSQTK